MKWRDQIRELRIPYPAKHELENEIKTHLELAADERQQAFTQDALDTFYETHNTRLFRALDGRRDKALIETLAAGVPLAAFLFLLTKEAVVFDFMREGGPGMIVIVLISSALLLRELVLGLRIFVIKDHGSVQIDSTATLISAVALALVGLLGTCGGIYRSASAGLEHMDIFIKGFSESMTCLIVASASAALVLFIHYSIRRTLAIWRVPMKQLAD